MPYFRRNRFRRFRPRFRRRMRRGVGAPLGRAPRWNYSQRKQQNLTRMVVHLKQVQLVSSDLNGVINWGINSLSAPVTGDFQTYGSLYNEYKVLKVSAKIIPANVGGESAVIGPNPGGQFIPNFIRGDAVTWVSTDEVFPYPTPNAINDVLNRSSARLIQPRRIHYRWINRARGFPNWGKLNSAGAPTFDDTWQASLRMYGNGFTPVNIPGSQVFFYIQVTFKCLFRSRQE